MSRSINYVEGWDTGRTINYTSSVNEIIDAIEKSSSGIMSGLEISDAGGGDIAISAGVVKLKISNSDDADSDDFNIAAVSSHSLVADQTTYVYVEYNSGAPQITYQTSLVTDDFNTKVIIGVVVYDGVDTHINTGFRQLYSSSTARILSRIYETENMKHVSGASLSYSLLSIAISAGEFWQGTTRRTTSAFDSSGSDTFSYWYGSVGSFTEITSQSNINTTQYDNAGSLATMSAGYFRADYIYIDMQDNVSIVMGKAQYPTASQALDEDAPAAGYVPRQAIVNGIIVGKLAVVKNASSLYDVKSAFEQLFTYSSTNDHGALVGLSDDDHSQYLLLAGRSGTDNTINVESGQIHDFQVNSTTISQISSAGLLTGVVQELVSDGGIDYNVGSSGSHNFISGSTTIGQITPVGFKTNTIDEYTTDSGV
ncbi:hypothetical protein KY366_06760, partial [Candidatus Woesearchaeota archaeon]|nr:hypothetical protein [Candidatus Woesearchaeota archaeon]